MASMLFSGPSEACNAEADVDTSSHLGSVGQPEQELSAVPQHPHAAKRATTTSSEFEQSLQLSSVTHPTITGSNQQAPKDNDANYDTQPKRKSIGSKLLSKFKHTSVDNKAESSYSTRSHLTSGSQSPSPLYDEGERAATADELHQALTKEQQRRATTKQASFSSMDGVRQRGIFRAKKQKQAHLDSDAEEHDASRNAEKIPHYLSMQPAHLDKFRSDATRHLPGGLYATDNDSLAARREEHTSRIHRKDSKRTARASHPEQDVFTSVGDLHDDPFADDHNHDYNSDDSDDTIAHLIRDADGYDSLRYNQKGELSAGLDLDTLQALREKERAANSRDTVSGYSAYSGGAAKALSQPLLELEDIELETFLQNFARHTREVTVTRPAGMQKYRMPQWSDFRVSQEDGAAASPNNKRPPMLTRVDRGLHHLTDTSGPHSNSKGTSGVTMPERSQTETPSMPRTRSSEDNLVLDSACGANGHDAKPTLSSKKKSKSKPPRKQHSATSKGSTSKDLDGEEDWDLNVPSSANPESLGVDSPHEEIRVNAKDEGVDGVAFCIAYILALVERLAPEEIDHHPDRGYREGLIRSHIERLYTIAPFWEQLASRIRRLYRWEDPKTTAAAAMIYFVLWYTNMIPTAFILMIMFYIMRFKYFPPSESYLHEQVKMRMARGYAANTLSEKLRRRSRLDILNIYKRWAAAFGAPTQETMGVVADFHEKVKNLILWRNPAATRRTLILFGVLNLFVTFMPSQYISKAIFFFVGITFFCLLPLQSYFPSHRKALSPLWWATFGAPTDAQFAIQLLRKRHLDLDRFAGQLTTAEDVRRAVRTHGGLNKLKPRPDRREEGIAYDQIEDPSRANVDYVEMSKDATLKPRKLGSFFCQYKGLPGRLHVNTKYLYFTPLHSPSHKRGRTPVDAIESIVKTKSIRLWVWSSLGLKIVRNNGKAPLLLANLQNRDEAFNLILAVSANAGSKT